MTQKLIDGYPPCNRCQTEPAMALISAEGRNEDVCFDCLDLDLKKPKVPHKAKRKRKG